MSTSINQLNQCYQCTLPQQFYTDLRDRINQTQNSLATLRNHGRVDERIPYIQTPIHYPEESIPNTATLQNLVETVLWASIKYEEGRRLEFVVGYYHSCLNNCSVRPRLSLFQSARTFDVNNTFKLAPAVNNPGNGIVVGHNPEGTLDILGISLHIFSLPLTIQAIDAGELVVKFGLRPIAKVSGSETIFIEHPFSYRSHLIWSVQHADTSELWANANILITLRILHKMRNFGHGGILIILPQDSPVDETVEIPYQLEQGIDTSAVNALQEEMDADRQDFTLTPERNYPMSQYLRTESFADSIASLSCVDGAILIRQNIDIIGFGAKLSTTLIEGENHQVKEIDSRSLREIRTTTIEHIGGTRHQSTARFIARNPTSIAFVVSQDKNITALVWDNINNRISAYKNLDTTLA